MARGKWGKYGVRAILMRKQSGKCCYCGVQMTIPARKSTSPKDATLEHLRRRSEGGSDHRDNKALACRDCNQHRGQVDWLTYKTWCEERVEAANG